MPYVDLHCADDYASIYYFTNSPAGNVGGFDPEKPSVIMLHPFFLDSSWLDQQFGDVRLSTNYNMIAFDMRSCGRSSCRPSGRHDSWVDAADLAHCHQILNLPPCHILAFESISTSCALRFTVLFPEMCLSLTLCNVPPPTELKSVLSSYQDLMQGWSQAEDLESLEHVLRDCSAVIAGPDCDVELLDQLIAYWETHMPPSQIMRIAETLAVSMSRMALSSEFYSRITQPVLLIHGERNDWCPKQYAEKLASQLTNAEGGAILYTVKGGSNTLSIIPGYASIANQVFVKFISRLPAARSDLLPPETSRLERMKLALADLADIAGNSKITSRDPLSSLSFSCLPAGVVERQTQALREYRKGLHRAFNPCGPDGRPLRKYSNKVSAHWFYGGDDGLSVAETTYSPMQQPDRPDKASTPPPEDSLVLNLKFDGRLRRPVTSPVDKIVIKGAMAAFAAVPNPPTIQRIKL